MNFATKSRVELYQCNDNGEYAFIVNTGSGITGITNLGKYIVRNGSGFINKSKLGIKGIVTSACYNASIRTLFAGREDGSVCRWEDSGSPESFSAQTESSKVTVVTCSNDGQWLSAGYVNGRVLLWKLDSIQAAPAVLIKDPKSYNSESNSITGLCFSREQNGDSSLVITTRAGYMYLYPVSMDALALRVCTRNMFIKKTEWEDENSSIPKSIKYKKLCP